MESIIEIYKVESLEPRLTVALPVYNSKEIAWAALESLSNQIDINFNWELIVYEEKHKNSVFPEILDHYIEKLKQINCTRIVFITNTEHILLIDKWVGIANNVSPTSSCFILHAADCYSPKNRLQISYQKIVNEDYDWYDQSKGYFYSFISDKVFLYDYKGLTNLNMALKPEYVKTLPKSVLKKGIDGYIYNWSITTCKRSGKNFRRYFDDELYQDSIDTHGFNNISIGRENYFTTKPAIFSETNLTYLDLGWSEIVKERIKTKTDVYELSIIISTYKNVEYLKECFDSIGRSIGLKNVEVLIGVDGCPETKEYILMNSFPSNFKFYNFEKNNGPYIVFNTLSKIAQSKKLLFFGSDDIMDSNMIEDMVTGLSNYDCVKPQYKNFTDGKPYDSGNKKHIGEGVFAIKKEIFDYLNGFEPWMCGADSDFMGRLYKQKQYSIRTTTRVNFYRRIHKNGLTSRPDTGMGSKLRAHYSFLSRSKKIAGPLDNMVTEQFTEIKNNVIVYSKKTIENVIPNPPVNKTPAVNSIFGRVQTPVPQQRKEIEKPKKPEPQIKERPKIEPKKEISIPEQNKDTNTLSNKAKEYNVNKKIENIKKQNNPKYNIGKDSLRI